jgi:uncharacterized protein YecT (DUF1311 family)
MRCPTLFALAFVFAAAHADPIGEVDCSQPQHAQRIVNHCSSVKFKEADGRLTALFEKVLAALPDEGDRARLKAAEDAWLQYRSAQCVFEAPPSRRGSMWSAVYTTCARHLTEAHIAQLQSTLDCTLHSGENRCGQP